MHDLATIHRLNDEAVRRSQAAAPAGWTVTLLEGLHVVETHTFHEPADALTKLAQLSSRVEIGQSIGIVPPQAA